jgi:NAD(P) transhydrogenase subunit alpha
MKIVSVSEDKKIERRIAITPDIAKKYVDLGFKVSIVENYGEHLGFKDNEYKELGVKISKDTNEVINGGDVIVQLGLPSDDKVSLIRENQTLIGILNPYENKSYFNDLNKNNITSCCMELIPRISRAQSMDVLSSQANLAGYKAVIDAAAKFGKAFPMMMTAAGRINPAKVMILGVGVSGLQAIATAKRLGAVVSATDVRSATKEQVESLGGKFIMVEDEESKEAETSGGYAKEMSDEYKKKQEILIAETVSKQDIVICTALIPGRPAPVLITEVMVNSMTKGSVVVDLAVEAGGNCPLSKVGEIIDHKGVKIIGYANVPGRVAKDASSLYARNIANFLTLMINKEEKKININLDDEIINAVVLTYNGKIKLENFL